ncbi:uncharacterized protein LOC125683239 isoform X2 [Ostrea edulis]|uniref:uncharacterized protein LOC125683239 isoform X2 n=1 Tax=Ostrea edulis TaxID=37623 RepID=UPI0024AF28B9|nr:uncharacterized protein LOC125683239 isoform X2 [Ostrea edulis]
MGFIHVNSCPADSETRQQLAKQCQNSDQYHCLFNDFSQTVSGCNDWIWVEPGYCPVYISEALQMDTEKCQHQCPEIDRSYKSFNVYKYSRCYTNQQLHSSSTAAVSNLTEAPDPLPPGGSSFNVAAVVVPVLLVVIIAVVVFAVLIHRRYKDDRTTDNSKRKKNHSRITRRMLSCNVENIPLHQWADGNSRQTENINVENLAEDTTLVLGLANNLQKHRTLALTGEWGSGKRTLAVQIALQVEKIEKKTFKFKVLQEFDDDKRSKLEAIKTTDPTILLMPDLCRSWHTEHHTTNIMNCVRSIISSNTYIIATIRNAVYKSCTKHTRSSIDDVFTQSVFIRPTHETLSKIVHKFNFTNDARTEILKLNTAIGTPLIITLCMKNPAYRTRNFLRDPLSFIISDLKKMRRSGDGNVRMKFEILVYIMLQGGTVAKYTLENCSDPSLLAITGEIPNMLTYIQECVKELCGYLEETADGKFYRTLHEVITRCIFLAAAERELLSLFGKCDAFLLFDCIRHLSRREKIVRRSPIILDTKELKVGIPPVLYQGLANVFKQRGDDLIKKS